MNQRDTTRSMVSVLDGPLTLPNAPPFVNPDNEVGKETDVTKDQVQFNSSQSTARVQPPVVQIREKVQNKGKEPVVELRVHDQSHPLSIWKKLGLPTLQEEIAFLDGLLEDENFFEMNDKKVEFLERKTKEDFETKVEPKSKQELQVFHPDIEILDHFETTSYVGSDYVFYEDFSLVDIIFPVNIQGKVFDPGISHFEKDVFDDKSSKELAPSKALLTLDVFDPLHPPLMDFHVT
ncbi:hypothetical protein Tco_0990652 [Tanacetum coccineum]|uniref:Reverse transcriptase domain-containing protein n=1 Tax=Tanacetum coccineum TaxID=301880 RepID=A0ABQ5EXU7_9ASTR